MRPTQCLHSARRDTKRQYPGNNAPHVQKVASKAAASLYALRMLKAHGLDGQALWEVTQATLCKLGMEWVCQVGGKD